MSFEALWDSEIVLVDVNPTHLEPVSAFSRKVVKHYDAPTRIETALNWRDGVLEGADFVMTSFAQGGHAYCGVPFHAFLERDLNKAFFACAIDPSTAATATPATIRECFDQLLEAERPWLEPYWGHVVG